jgi:hypothetical protein
MKDNLRIGRSLEGLQLFPGLKIELPPTGRLTFPDSQVFNQSTLLGTVREF